MHFHILRDGVCDSNENRYIYSTKIQISSLFSINAYGIQATDICQEQDVHKAKNLHSVHLHRSSHI